MGEDREAERTWAERQGHSRVFEYVIRGHVPMWAIRLLPLLMLALVVWMLVR